MSEAEIHAVANQIATETAARLYAVLLDGGALPILDSQEPVVEAGGDAGLRVGLRGVCRDDRENPKA